MRYLWLASNCGHYVAFGLMMLGPSAALGNALRPSTSSGLLLSSLQGAAITSVKIDGVQHEFTSLAGVRVPRLRSGLLGPKECST